MMYKPTWQESKICKKRIDLIILALIIMRFIGDIIKYFYNIKLVTQSTFLLLCDEHLLIQN